jgi:hypothetical protein
MLISFNNVVGSFVLVGECIWLALVLDGVNEVDSEPED